jgi:glycosyltransferase involved in cell wall biosynthesis
LSTRKIIGISLVRNEDIFIHQALINVINFCDEIIVADHGSNDRTAEIVLSLAKDNPKIHYQRIKNASESHELIRVYANSNTWVFPVDGDELYDPYGLKRLRSKIMSGQFDSYRQCYGNVLHCTDFNLKTLVAKGYLSPPSRTMTKLYNFGAIYDWEGPCLEKCLGGRILFKEGFSEHSNLCLHEKMGWDESYFRCMHMVFQRRSSLDSQTTETRKNIVEIYGSGYISYWFHRLFDYLGVEQKSSYKKDQYRRGELVSIDSGVFFEKVN